MEIYEHDKTHKAYYVFPYGTLLHKAIEEVAREKHINPKNLKSAIGKIKGNELFLHTYTPDYDRRAVVVYRRTKGEI